MDTKEGFSVPIGTTASIVPESYSPIVLSYRGKDGKRQWELNFQLAPEPRITFHGDDPTTDELVECLRYITAPIWFIDICRVAIGAAKAVTPNVKVTGLAPGKDG